MLGLHWRKVLAKRAPLWTLLCGIIFLASCSPSRYVRPLQKDQWAVSGTLGGPIFRNFGAPIPIPYTTLALGHGFSEKVTGWAAFHPTSAAFGVIQSDIGAVYGLRKPEGWTPGVSFSPVANLAVDVWQGNFKFWPQVDANLWWEYGQHKHFCYAGLSTWFELAGTKAHREEQGPQLFPGFQIGNTLSFKEWEYSLEVKWNGINLANQGVTLDYLSPAGQGAIGVGLAFTRKF